MVVRKGSWITRGWVPFSRRFERRQKRCQLVEMHKGTGEVMMERLLGRIHSEPWQQYTTRERSLRQMAAGEERKGEVKEQGMYAV